MTHVKPSLEITTKQFVEYLYGASMSGFLGLWNLQTKQTKWFDRKSFNSLLSEIENNKLRQDLYLCISTQKEQLSENKRGCAHMVDQIFCFFADIDHAQDKASSKNYPPNEEASLSILGSFPHKPTAVQRSGNGLHVFWRFKVPFDCETDEDRRRAKTVCSNFQELLIDHFQAKGYEIDKVGDTMRLFRAPGTFNLKSSSPKPVEIIEYNPENIVDPLEFERSQNVSSVAQSSHGNGSYDEPADHDQIRSECRFYEEVTGDGASACPEPYWFSAASITAGCENGENIFHDYSRGHPKYNQREAQQKFERARDAGSPHTCNHIASSGASERFCKDCPHFGKIHSPLQLGQDGKQPDLMAIANSGGWAKYGRGDQPIGCYQNAYIALVRLGVELRYDQFRQRLTVYRHLIQQFSGDMSDDALAVLRKIAADRFGFDPGKLHLSDAAQALALENAFHPIRDYLDGLSWDGTERLQSLLHKYFGAEDTKLNRLFSTLVLIAAVRRVRQPGYKFDAMLVLEGPQGSGKSTAIKILAGEDNFSDQSIIGLDQKTQGELVGGVWLYECAELSGMRHGDTNDLKSFLSRETDRYRAAYARFTTSCPRQCVFIGTTNDETYLKDVTGNRRFWPAKTNEIDLDALTADRDQLWAEAAQLEAQGHSIVLPKEYWDEAAKLQAMRMPDDPWLDVLSQIENVDITNGEMRISTKILFGPSYLNIPANQQQDYLTKRLSRVMGELGWDGPKALRIDGKAQRGYSKPVDPDEETGVEY